MYTVQKCIKLMNQCKYMQIFCTCILMQITLPVQITARYGHSAVVFGSGASFRVVVLFGGRVSVVGIVTAETTLLLLGEWTISATDM